ncbi:MAG: YfhO family protein [Planctomycetes bacterium]|nr:YfhO family protein [Planctomycetota bacterium]
MAPSAQSPSRRQRWQAILLALLCSLGFLRESLLPDRALVPYPPELFDVVRAEAIAKGTFDAADAHRGNTGGGDKYLQSLCWDRIMQDRLRAGELPLWTRDIVSGAPFVPQMAQVYEPINLLLLLLPGVGWYGWWFLIHQVLFGFLCYLFLRRLDCGHGGALLGVVAAVLGLWTQCKIHHNVILTAALPLWPMLSGVFDLVRAELTPRRRWRTIAGLSLWSGISWLSGFAVVSLQVTYLTVAFAGVLTWQRPRGQRLRPLVGVGIGLLLGGLLSFAHMIPVLQASMVSARDSSWNPTFLAAHGLEWDHALSLLWPDLLSWPADVFYPDPQNALADATRMPWTQLLLLSEPLSPVTGNPFQSWVETSYAVGTAPLACAVLALFDRARRTQCWFFAAAGLLAFGFATADEPWLSLARFVPGIGSADLRRLLFTTAMALVVLSALGADRLLAAGRRCIVITVLGLIAAASIAALCWLLVHRTDEDFTRGIAELFAADADHHLVQQAQGNVELIVAQMKSAQAAGELAVNWNALFVTGLRGLLVTGALIAALFVLRARWRTAAIVTITAVDLLLTGLGPMQTVPAERVTTAPAVVTPMFAAAAPNGVRPRLGRLAAPTESRIASWYPGNLPGCHGLEDATGYNPLPAARFEEFFEAIEPNRRRQDEASMGRKVNVAFGGAGVGAFHDPASLNHPLCDLFGIRFILTREQAPAGTVLLDRTPPSTGDYRLFERLTVLPRATFVREVDVVTDRQQRLRLLGDRERDVARRIVLEDAGAIVPAALVSAHADVQIVEHRDERVVIAVAADADGYLRLADPYDAGWTATVDGIDAPVLPADHYLRAVYVGPGRHEVVFRYDSLRVRWPRYVSLAALLAVLLLASGWLGRRR